MTSIPVCTSGPSARLRRPDSAMSGWFADRGFHLMGWDMHVCNLFTLREGGFESHGVAYPIDSESKTVPNTLIPTPTSVQTQQSQASSSPRGKILRLWRVNTQRFPNK
jgi:hypothetical protein